MGIVIRLDEFERRRIGCQACFERGYKGKMTIHRRIKGDWHLQCPYCLKIWSELSIRQGKAEGVLVLNDS